MLLQTRQENFWYATEVEKNQIIEDMITYHGYTRPKNSISKSIMLKQAGKYVDEYDPEFIHENLDITPMIGEIWRPIAKTDGYYSISNLGRTKGNDRTITMRNGTTRFVPSCICHTYNSHGNYYICTFKRDGKGNEQPVHLAVSIAFLNYIIQKGFVCDRIRPFTHDNRVINLQILTASENIRKSRMQMTFSNTKFSLETRANVISDYNTHKYSMKQLGVKYNVSESTIGNILHNRFNPPFPPMEVIWPDDLNKPLTEDQVREIRQLWNEGMSKSKIMRTLGLSYGKVRSALERYKHVK